MTSANSFDAGPLSWVKGEIDLALERVAQGLQQFGANPGDLGQIKYCRTHLHQVRGALTIVGLDGATQFTDSLEALLTDIEAGKQPADTPRIALIGRSVSSIRRFLDDLLAGDPNQPLRLFDLYAQIAVARGLPSPSASDLFFPDLTVHPQLPALPPGGDGAERLKTARARYQKGLLALIKAPDRPVGALELKLAAQMAAGADASSTLRGFWWAAGGFFTAMGEKSVAVDAETRSLCARIDQQLRQQLDGSRTVPEKLMRDVLFQVALARSRNAEVLAIREAFDLVALIPSADAKSVSLAAQIEPLLKRLREIVTASEEAWNKFCTGSEQSLKVFCEATAALDQGAERLGHAEFRRLIQAVAATAQWIRDNRARHNEAVALEMATGILLIGNGVDNFTRLGADFVRQVDIMVSRLQACTAGTPLARDAEVPMLDEMTRRAQEKLLIAQVVKEIQSSLGQIEQALDTFFREPEQKEQLAGCQKPISQIVGALSILGHLDAVTQLQASAKQIAVFQSADYAPDQKDFERVARQLSALGFFVEALQSGVSDYHAFISSLEVKPSRVEAASEPVVEVVGEPAVEHATAAAQADESADAPDLVLEMAEAPQAPAGDAAAAPETVSPSTGIALAEAVPVKEEPVIDAELLEIFLEEAQEVAGTIGEQLDVLREHPSDMDALTTLRRAFHTLKGSSRMVGLMDFGEVAWVIEQVHNLWLRQERPVDDSLLELVEAARAVFSTWIGHLAGNGDPLPDASALVAMGEKLKGTETITAPGRPLPSEEQAAVASETVEASGGDLVLEPAPEVSFELDLPVLEIETPFAETSLASFEAMVEPAAESAGDAQLSVGAESELTVGFQEMPAGEGGAASLARDDSDAERASVSELAMLDSTDEGTAGELSTDRPVAADEQAGEASWDVESIDLVSLVAPPQTIEAMGVAGDAVALDVEFATSEVDNIDLVSMVVSAGEAGGDALTLDLSEPSVSDEHPGGAIDVDLGDAGPALTEGAVSDNIVSDEVGASATVIDEPHVRTTGALFVLDLDAEGVEPSVSTEAVAPVDETATLDVAASVEPAVPVDSPAVEAGLDLELSFGEPDSSLADEAGLVSDDGGAASMAAVPSPVAVTDAPDLALDLDVEGVGLSVSTEAVAPVDETATLDVAVFVEPAVPVGSPAVETGLDLEQSLGEPESLSIDDAGLVFDEGNIESIAAPSAVAVADTPDFVLDLDADVESSASTEAVALVDEVAVIDVAASVEPAVPVDGADAFPEDVGQEMPASISLGFCELLTAAEPEDVSLPTAVPEPASEAMSPLLQIFLEEAVQHVATLQRCFGELEIAPEAPTSNEMVRAAHTLGSISGTVGFPAALKLGRAVEAALLRRDKAGNRGSFEALETLRIAIAELEAMVAAIGRSESLPEIGVLVSQVDDLYPGVAAETLEAAASSLATMAEPVPMTELPPAIDEPLPDDQLDDSLLPIFLEEAADLVAGINERFGMWSANPYDTDTIHALTRLLHTLKGSARMAGAMRLGALTHRLESSIEAAHRAGGADPVLIAALQADFDDVAELSEHLGDALVGTQGETSDDAVALELPESGDEEPVAPAGVSAAESLPVEFPIETDTAELAALVVEPLEAPELAPLIGAAEAEVAFDFDLDRPEASVLSLDFPEEIPLEVASDLAFDTDTVCETVQKSDEVAALVLAPSAADHAVGIAESVVATLPVTPASPTALVADALPEDHLDEDLLPIFLEEAVELVRNVYEQLDAWQAAPSDGAASHALARSLHTLKGSARMAGAMALGALTHTLESRAEEASKSGQVSATLIEQMKHAFDLIAQIVERLQRGEALADLLAPAVAPVEVAVAPATVAVAAVAAVAEPPSPPAVELPEVPAAPAKPVVPPTAVAPSREVVAAAALTKPAAAPRKDVDASKAMLRVPAGLIDVLVNDAGELSIARARIEGEMRSLKQSLLDLTENVIRLRRQLREIEIQAESQMQSRTAVSADGKPDFDPLELDRFTRFQEVTRMMAESVNDVATVQLNLLKNLDEANASLAAQARLNRELQQSLMSVRMVPFASITERLQRIVRQTAKELGKRVDLDIQGAGIELDQNVINKMIGPFEHLLRNGISHGIEAPSQRVEQGKDETGRIQLVLRQEGNEVIITMTDDGAGLNFSRIREKAIANGLMTADEPYDERKLTEMIFRSGFSTAVSISQIAGRGVGMDVVMTEVSNLGGRIDVSSESGKGSVFRIYLPLTLAVTNAVIVRIGSRYYAIPAAMIDQVRELKENALADMRAAGGADWLGNHYPFHFLPHLLGEPDALPEARRMYWVLYLHSGLQRVAVQVDELQSSHEIVVKNIGPQLSRVVGIAGATVMGDGRVILILNPVALAARTPVAAPVATSDGGSAAPAAPAMPVVEEVVHLPTVLVVDDSLTVRKITSRLLAREGYQVFTAKDGQDALEQMVELVPDVILSDIEMPRMDGFELARNIRADERLVNIPIVMISSRTADKHRSHAAELGVNHFLGKPYQEEELLGLIAGFIAEKRARA